MMGELSAETLKSRGYGYIVDGGSVMLYSAIGLPGFLSLSHPARYCGKMGSDATDIPITIGDVLIRSGLCVS